MGDLDSSLALQLLDPIHPQRRLAGRARNDPVPRPDDPQIPADCRPADPEHLGELYLAPPRGDRPTASRQLLPDRDDLPAANGCLGLSARVIAATPAVAGGLPASIVARYGRRTLLHQTHVARSSARCSGLCPRGLMSQYELLHNGAGDQPLAAHLERAQPSLGNEVSDMIRAAMEKPRNLVDGESQSPRIGFSCYRDDAPFLLRVLLVEGVATVVTPDLQLPRVQCSRCRLVALLA